MVRFFRGLESALVVVALLLLAGGLPGTRRGGIEPVDGEGDPLTQALWRGMYLLAALAVAANWRPVVRTVSRHPWVVILALMAIGSWAWADLPADSLRRSISLLATTFVGLYLGTRFEFSTVIRLLAWSLGLAALFSLAAGIAWPAVGIADGRHLGAWMGVFGTKNVLGRAMVLGFFTCLYLVVTADRRRWAPGAGMLLCTLLVVLSTSKTAVVVGITLGLAIPLYNALRSPRAGAWLTALVALLVGGSSTFLVAMRPDEALSALGRDATLSGRTRLWEAVWDQISQRPFLGHGVGFWSEKNDHAAALFQAVRWETPHAHNGFFDLGLELGLVGVGLFAISFLLVSNRVMAGLREGSRDEALWMAVFLTFLLFYNLTESSLFRTGSLFWVLYVAVVARVWLWKDRTPADGVQSDDMPGLSPGVRRLSRKRAVAALTVMRSST
jgi:exopolysaccharide production protein ExoQ